MAWSKRERIDAHEARNLGLTHVGDGDYITASPSRKSVIVQDPEPTGFVKKGGDWHVVEYHGYMAGNFKRAPDKDAVPYHQWLSGTGRGVFHDRRGTSGRRFTGERRPEDRRTADKDMDDLTPMQKMNRAYPPPEGGL